MTLKQLEKTKAKDRYRLKHQKLFTIKLGRIGTYEAFHATRNHYEIPAKTKT